MELNDVGSIFVGWGMSMASKRAKEHQNRSSNELVMAEKNQPKSISTRVGRPRSVGCPVDGRPKGLDIR